MPAFPAAHIHRAPSAVLQPLGKTSLLPRTAGPAMGRGQIRGREGMTSCQGMMSSPSSSHRPAAHASFLAIGPRGPLAPSAPLHRAAKPATSVSASARPAYPKYQASSPERQELYRARRRHPAYRPPPHHAHWAKYTTRSHARSSAPRTVCGYLWVCLNARCVPSESKLCVLCTLRFMLARALCALSSALFLYI